MGAMTGRPRPLRLRRLMLGLTQGEVAQKAGVSLDWISRLERGVERSSLKTRARIAQALDCDVDVIFPRTDAGAPRKDRGPDPMDADRAPVATSTTGKSSGPDSPYTAT